MVSYKKMNCPGCNKENTMFQMHIELGRYYDSCFLCGHKGQLKEADGTIVDIQKLNKQACEFNG